MPDDHQPIDVSYEMEGFTEQSKERYVRVLSEQERRLVSEAVYGRVPFTPNPPGTGNFNTKRRKARRLRAKGKK